MDDGRYPLRETLIDIETLLMNTDFQQLPEKLITYKTDKQIKTEPTYVKGIFDTIDYFITTKRWKQMLKNVYSDIKAEIDSDHDPRIVEICQG